MCDEYVQEFKKVARGSSYERRPLIKEFKRGLSGAIRRKLAKAEKPPTTIGEWQERAVRLDKNQSITNGHLLICDWCFRILKGSKNVKFRQ